jgi:hypothetical protein
MMVHHQVLPFVELDLSFDQPTTAILRTAYDRALAELHDRGPDSVRHALARRIVTLASAGERNPDRLCDKALVAVGVLPQ